MAALRRESFGTNEFVGKRAAGGGKNCGRFAKRCASETSGPRVSPSDDKTSSDSINDTNPMKHSIHSLKLLGLGSLLALAFALTPTFLRAGLPQPASHRANSSPADVSAVNPGDTGAMTCGACRTISITERRQLEGTKAGTALFTTDSRHECAMCRGAIVTVNGTTVDTMQRDCPMCAKGAALCCAAHVAATRS